MIWFHSLPEDTDNIIENELFEQIQLSVFQINNKIQVENNIFSGNFNEFINFIAQQTSYKEIEIFLPADKVLLTQVSIPSNSKRRIMQALPFLLDEQLLNNSDEYYFAPGDISRGHCNVAIVKKHSFTLLYNQFKKLSLPVSMLSSEIFLLPWHSDSWSVAFMHSDILIRTGAQSGLAVSIENSEFILQLLLNNARSVNTHNSDTEAGQQAIDETEVESIEQTASLELPEIMTIYTEQNTLNIKKISTIAEQYQIKTKVVNNELADIAITEEALILRNDDKSIINLLQGQYHADNFKTDSVPYFKSLVAVIFLFVLSQMTLMAFQWMSLNDELNNLDGQLEALYFKTFPESKRLVDIRVQTESNFKQLKKNTAIKSSFFNLLGLVVREVRLDKNSKINALKYNDGILQLEIISHDFVTNRLKSALYAKHKIIVEKASLARIDGKVHATLNFKKNTI